MFQPLSRAEERLIRRLQGRRQREASGLLIAEGIRVVEDLLASELAIELAVTSPRLEEGERGAALLTELRERAPVRRVDDRAFARLAGTTTPQGVLAIAEIPDASLAELELARSLTILVLDGVQDPGNLGTLVRTADALGSTAVVTLPGTVDPWNPKSVRASSGAAFRIPIVETDLESLMGWLRAEGISLYGAAVEGDDAGQVELMDRAALIVGNEGAGLSRAALDAVDQLLAIPIESDAESLNVAVATGILLFLLRRGGKTSRKGSHPL